MGTSPYNVPLGTTPSYNLRGAQPGSSNNTAIGDSSMSVAAPLLTGSYNTAIGASSLLYNRSGASNCAMGVSALLNNSSGSDNIGIGYEALRVNTTGYQNTAIGRYSFYQCNFGGTGGYGNVGLGYQSGWNCTTGYNNTFLGTNCGSNISSGYGNTFIGQVTVNGALATGTVSGVDTSNTVIIATSDVSSGSKQRLYIHSNGYAGFGLGNNSIPQNSLEIGSLTPPFTGTVGLRFRGINNMSRYTTTATSNRRVLSINENGDVIFVDDIGGGITQSCSTAGLIPLNSATAGVLSCSQIFDNGTSVGIASTGPFGYTSLSNFQLGSTIPPSSGNFKLDVNGVTRSVAFFASSDKKFKKEIKTIESPLETIEKIDGKTYLWNTEANKEIGFDNGLHSGFIAQELEKVLPHLVATDEKGNKAVNYMELMPYLVEAIKEQQTQINDLKAQISDNFKAQNQDLISFTNTKIISVSPNPSRDVIAVSLNIDKGIENASLQVFDLNGKMLSNLSIKERETNISKTLQKDNFGQGIYIVSLVVNGKSIDTKKIVFE